MIDIVTTVIIAIIAALPGLYAILAQRGKDKADVAEKYEAMAGRAAEQIEQLRRRIDEMERQIDVLEAELEARDKIIVEWQAGIDILINQLVATGQQPIWRPKKGGKSGG